MNDKIAESLIQQMGAQIGLFISISLGVCGGLIFLAIQVMLCNYGKEGEEKTFIGLRAFSLWAATFILEGASICAGALARTAITGLTPTIYHLDFSAMENWTQADFAGSESLKSPALAQLMLFFIGMLTLLFFVIANRILIKGVPHGGKK